MNDAGEIVRNTIGAILPTAMAATGAQGASAHRSDREGGLALAGSFGTHLDRSADQLVAARLGSVGQVAVSGQSLALAPSSAAGPATVCVPCGSATRLVGVLELTDKLGGGAFSIDDVELAQHLAGVAAELLVLEPAYDDELAVLLRLREADPRSLAHLVALAMALLRGG